MDLIKLVEQEFATGAQHPEFIAGDTVTVGYKIKEVPITFIERENGKSKMSFAIVIEAWRMVSLEGSKRRIICR